MQSQFMRHARRAGLVLGFVLLELGIGSAIALLSAGESPASLVISRLGSAEAIDTPATVEAGPESTAPATEPLPLPTLGAVAAQQLPALATAQPSFEPQVLAPAAPTPEASPPQRVSAAGRVTRSPLALSVEFDPPVARVGSKLVIKLGITNNSAGTVMGVEISTGGSWETLTVLNIAPSAQLEQDGRGWHIQSATRIAPHETADMYVTVTPNQEGDQPLTFVAYAVGAELAGT
jgi:hypothetical protein